MWIAVNKNGDELASNSLMGRASEWLDRCIERNMNYAMYSDSCSGVWANSYSCGYFEVPTFNGIIFPKGTIKMLTGKDMTWEDEPVKIDSYE